MNPVEANRSRVLSDLAAALAPLMNMSRDRIYLVRFVGSRTELFAFASDGHVLALVTVLGDYSHVGDATLPGDVVHRLGLRDWGVEPWLPWLDTTEGEEQLSAEAHLRPVRDTDLSLEQILKVLPGSRAPAAADGWFLGAALTHAGAVVRRLGLMVQFSGVADPMRAMRLDSLPRPHPETGELMWASLAIMPAQVPKW